MWGPGAGQGAHVRSGVQLKEAREKGVTALGVGIPEGWCGGRSRLRGDCPSQVGAYKNANQCVLEWEVLLSCHSQLQCRVTMVLPHPPPCPSTNTVPGPSTVTESPAGVAAAGPLLAVALHAAQQSSQRQQLFFCCGRGRFGVSNVPWCVARGGGAAVGFVCVRNVGGFKARGQGGGLSTCRKNGLEHFACCLAAFKQTHQRTGTSSMLRMVVGMPRVAARVAHM